MTLTLQSIGHIFQVFPVECYGSISHGAAKGSVHDSRVLEPTQPYKYLVELNTKN